MYISRARDSSGVEQGRLGFEGGGMDGRNTLMATLFPFPMLAEVVAENTLPERPPPRYLFFSSRVNPNSIESLGAHVGTESTSIFENVVSSSNV